MPLSISTNIASLTAQRSFMNTNAALETAFERLSTGKRVNTSVDDAAGLAIGKSLEARVSGLNQAVRNTNDGISMVQIAEGALDEVTSILQRMRDLAVQASNGSLGTAELGYLDAEHSKLATTLNDVLDQATFNGIDLIDTNAAVPLTFQVGADNGDTLAVSIDSLSSAVLEVLAADIALNDTGTSEVVNIDMNGVTTFNEVFTLTVDGETFTTANSATSLAELKTLLDTAMDGTASVAVANTDDLQITFEAVGQHSAMTFSSSSNTGLSPAVSGTGSREGIDSASTAINTIDRALAIVASDRADLGAIQAQMESTVRNLANVAENTAAAQGRIMDTDYAAETANLTKAQILQQAATSILAQANSQPQSVLSLLQ